MSYEIDHQKLSDHIFSIVRKTSVVSGLYVFLVFIIVGFTYLLLFGSIFGSIKDISTLSNNPEAFEAMLTENTVEMMLLNSGISILAHYLLSGIYGIIIKSEYAPIFGISDVFKTLFSTKGLKALNIIVYIQIISGIISYYFSLTEFHLVGFAISILIQFLTYFALPAVYIDRLGIRKSLQFSINTVNQKPGFMFMFLLMSYFVSLSGIFLFGIGILFTLPINYIVAYCLYKHISNQ